MNMRKVINTIFWTRIGQWFISDKDLDNCALPEERECYRTLRNFFGLGFAPLVASMAYLLIGCEVFPLVKHLVNDTKMIDWVMAGFVVNAGFHLICLILSIKAYANRVLGNHTSMQSQRVENTKQDDVTNRGIEPKSVHGLTIHNTHLHESNLKAVLQSTFGTKYQHPLQDETEQEKNL